MVKYWFIVMFFCLLSLSNSAQNKDINTKKPLEIGSTNNGNKTGVWKYYNLNGKEERREKYKNGELVWTIFFDERHKKTKTIDKNGKVKVYKNCNCSN